MLAEIEPKYDHSVGSYGETKSPPKKKTLPEIITKNESHFTQTITVEKLADRCRQNAL
jgi:hypothetical protein